LWKTTQNSSSPVKREKKSLYAKATCLSFFPFPAQPIPIIYEHLSGLTFVGGVVVVAPEQV
jgi:hypothetical protein